MNRKRQIKVLVACLDSNGTPVLVPLKWRTTSWKLYDGDHYDDIRAHMKQQGYETPFVIMDEDDMKSCGSPIRETLENMVWDEVPTEP